MFGYECIRRNTFYILSFYLLTLFLMAATRQIPKKELYKNWNFSVSTYNFEIPNWARAWKILHQVELKTKIKRWSEDIGAYYTQSQYITISYEQFADLLKTAKTS